MPIFRASPSFGTVGGKFNLRDVKKTLVRYFKDSNTYLVDSSKKACHRGRKGLHCHSQEENFHHFTPIFAAATSTWTHLGFTTPSLALKTAPAILKRRRFIVSRDKKQPAHVWTTGFELIIILPSAIQWFDYPEGN